MALNITAKATDQFVTVNGLRLHYLDWGNAAAPPLLLLHGFTGHAHTWDLFAQAMQPHYYVLALDQRGHGDSDWAKDGYNTDLYVADIEGFAQALGLERFVLVGLSLGGRNAYVYASRYPQRVQRLVIVDIGPQVVTAGAARVRASTNAADIFSDPEEAVSRLVAQFPRSSPAMARHRAIHNLKQMADGRWTWKYDEVFRRSSWEGTSSLPDEAQWEMLARIACPTLLVRGAESDILAVATAERMASTIPGCRLVTIAASGHSVPMDRPDEFEAAVRQFLGV